MRRAIMHNGNCTICGMLWSNCNCWIKCSCGWFYEKDKWCNNPEHKFCGACESFKWEDVKGWGYCDKYQIDMKCSQECLENRGKKT